MQWLPVEEDVGVVVVATVCTVKDLLRIDLALMMPCRFSSMLPVYKEELIFHFINLKRFTGNQTEITKSKSSNYKRFSTQRLCDIVSNNWHEIF